MTRFLTGCAVCALITASAGSALAADRVYEAHNAPMAVSGEVSLWVQGVIPTNVIEDDDIDCQDSLDEYCASVLGAGGYVGLQFQAGDNWAVIGDLTIDGHAETTKDPDDFDDPAVYAGFGAHLVYDAGETQWGVFGMAVAGRNHEEDGSVGPAFGGGVEARWQNVFVQAGYLDYFANTNDDDTIDNFYFGRVGGEFDAGPGMIEASVAVGGGDFDESDSDVDPGLWVQVSGEYEAPITESLNWFVGYQGDFLRVEDDGPDDVSQNILHTLRAGLTIPFGGGDMHFKSPNLRSPMTNAGEMN